MAFSDAPFSMSDMSENALNTLEKRMMERYNDFMAKNIKLDMSRGKPSPEQVALSKGLLSLPGLNADTVIDGIDAANYGTLEGLPACRRLFASLLNVEYDQIFIGGSSSLNLMYDTIAKAFTHGLLHSEKPWSKLDKVKFICVTPGYDRHFTICESFNIEMLSVPMLSTGPDMDMVERLIQDEDVRGMWCVPKFSNPDGTIYSEETILRLASMRPKAPDFLLMWDNAYFAHEFVGTYTPIPDILKICAENGNPDMVFEFASTSKVTFPGGGISCFACSTDNMAYMKKLYNAQTISFDKVNQLRHLLFFNDANGFLAHMKKHAALLAPRFKIVQDMLNAELSDLKVAKWKQPTGGYFISIDLIPGTAKAVHQLCANAGLKLTAAGATFPYGKDPNDSNLRIAPSYPTTDELKLAAELLCICIKLVSLRSILGKPLIEG